MSQLLTSRAVQSCLSLVRLLLYPSYFAFNALTSLYHVTHEEQQNEAGSILPRKVLLTPVYSAMFILFLPIMCVFLPLRCLLASVRTPFVYSEHFPEDTSRGDTSAREAMAVGGYRFGFGSANICLMPELLSRMNHLRNVDYRSVNIGRRIAEDQKRSQGEKVGNHSEAGNRTPSSTANNNSEFSDSGEVFGTVSASFPHLDVLCIQEAWSSYHNKALVAELHKSFPYIVHDVGIHSFNTNQFVLSSGHLIASRHRIVDIEFKAYDAAVDHGKIISMGLLMTKLQLGPTGKDGTNVAYVFNTHLQSYQGKHQIIPKQLDQLLEYSEEFIKRTQKSEDNIAFSIVCGDFNMDNISPADQLNTSHKIFNVFEDFGRLKPGTDKPWTLGTELRQDRMMDKSIATPELLKRAMEDPALRQCYLVDGDIKEQTKEALLDVPIKMDNQGNVRLVPEGGRRRIDYILFNRQYPLEVKGYHFVTRLTPLTDHIPVAMEFTCPNLR